MSTGRDIARTIGFALRPTSTGVWIRNPAREAARWPARIQPALMRDRPLGRIGRLALAAVVVTGAAFASIDLLTTLEFLSYAAVGALLVIRRPGNGVSWLLLVIPFCFIPPTTPTKFDVAALEAGSASTRDFLVSWLSAWSGFAAFVGYLARSILFPTGHLPEGRWRRPAIALIAAAAVVPLLVATAPSLGLNPDGGVTAISVPNRLAILPDLPFWSIIPTDGGTIPLVVFMAIGAGSMIVRYRRATGIVRLQLRWLVTAIAFVVVAITVGLSAFVVFGEEIGGIAWIPAIVAFPAVPAAIGIAILRYRLYEIDRLISRGPSWAVLTALLLVVYAGAVLVLQTALGSITQGETVAVAGSTLLAAALFQPFRRRIQAVVDRRFNRATYDARRTAIDFAERLRDQVDIASLSGDIAGAVDAALRPSSVGVWLRDPAPDVSRATTS
jgi:hypothetical protein